MTSLGDNHVVKGKRCPECGCVLVTDGERMWCDGDTQGDTRRGCNYGLYMFVALEDDE